MQKTPNLAVSAGRTQADIAVVYVGRRLDVASIGRGRASVRTSGGTHENRCNGLRMHGADRHDLHGQGGGRAVGTLQQDHLGRLHRKRRRDRRSRRSPRPRQVSKTIYISSQGRIFSQTERQTSVSLRETVQQTPSTSGLRFEGSRLIGAAPTLGGAVQMIISFDAGFQSCTASVQYGREVGKAFKFKGLNGETFTAKGVPTASTPTCSIRAGNAFAQ
jgi:hypothetical protein